MDKLRFGSSYDCLISDLETGDNYNTSITFTTKKRNKKAKTIKTAAKEEKKTFLLK